MKNRISIREAKKNRVGLKYKQDLEKANIKIDRLEMNFNEANNRNMKTVLMQENQLARMYAQINGLQREISDLNCHIQQQRNTIFELKSESVNKFI